MKVADIRSNLNIHNSRTCFRTQLKERRKTVLYMEITKIRINGSCVAMSSFGDMQIAVSKGKLLSGWPLH